VSALPAACSIRRPTVQRACTAPAPNRLWVTDLTVISTGIRSRSDVAVSFGTCRWASDQAASDR